MSPLRNFAARIEWQIWFGITVTVLYLGYGGIHLFSVVGWQTLQSQSLSALGSFLEGAFAPLAFLWLVVGYFLQHRALTANNTHIEAQYRELRRASEQAEIQAQAIAANELHVRRESFLQIAALVERQLEVTAGLLYLATQQRIGEQSSDPNLSELWTRVDGGDAGLFSRRLLDLCYSGQGLRPEGHRYFFGTSSRRQHTAEFMATFERLLTEADASDKSGTIRNALVQGSAHGFLYRTINSYQEHKA